MNIYVLCTEYAVCKNSILIKALQNGTIILYTTCTMSSVSVLCYHFTTTSHHICKWQGKVTQLRLYVRWQWQHCGCVFHQIWYIVLWKLFGIHLTYYCYRFRNIAYVVHTAVCIVLVILALSFKCHHFFVCVYMYLWMCDVHIEVQIQYFLCSPL